MATRLYKNNAASTLASAITAAATSLTVATGDGALFPAISGSDWFIVTLENGSTREIVKVTARTTDTFTVTRAQESTSAAAFAAGSKVELRSTAASFTATGGLTSYTTGDLLYAVNTTSLTSLADVTAGSYLRSGGVGAAPVWSTPTLPNAAGTAGKFLRSDGTNLPMSTMTLPDNVTTVAHLLGASASGVISSRLPYWHGQCRLTKSGTNLLLSPYNGNNIIINSMLMTVPDAGITLAVGAALTEGGIPAASTTYFIYAYNNAGTITLQASAITHATQAGTGVEIRSGDATRTLVGMARTTAGTAWADSATQRFTLSYFNRRNISGVNGLASNKTTTSTTHVEADSTARAEFLTWADEAVWLSALGRSDNNTAGQAVQTSVWLDGAAANVLQLGHSSTGGYALPFNASLTTSLSEGYHYAGLAIAVSANTGTWYGSASPPNANSSNYYVMTRG